MAILRVEDLTKQFSPQQIITEGKVVNHSRDPKMVVPILYFLNEKDYESFSLIAGPFYGVEKIRYSLTPSTHGSSYTHYGQPGKLTKLPDSDIPIVLEQTRQDRLLYELLTQTVYEELYNLIAQSK